MAAERKEPRRDLTTPQRALQKALESRGWDVVEIIDDNLPWWAYAVWRIESVWSPTGTRLDLTFLVDPCYENGPKRPLLYLVAVSREPLEDRLSEFRLGEMSMQHGWRHDLGQFISLLDTLR